MKSTAMWPSGLSTRKVGDDIDVGMTSCRAFGGEEKKNREFFNTYVREQSYNKDMYQLYTFTWR